MSKTLEATGSAGRALSLYRRSSELQREILAEQRQGQIAKLEIRYRLHARDTELELLRSNAELTSLALRRQRVLRNVLLGGLVSFLLVILLLINRHRRLARAARMIEEQKAQLESTLRELKVLRGFLPICAGCKKIRDDDEWCQLESYITDHSEARFSHGLCPECLERYAEGLPEIDAE